MSDSGLKFTVDSLLLGELGERLVTKNYIALAELIKNAYDADAFKVTVSFKVSNEKEGYISVEDNGHGMTFDEVKAYWMRVATPNKRRNPRSPRYGRIKTGDKGIGRFACRRLGRKLFLESIAWNEASRKYDRTTVEFDWNKFQDGLDLTEIPNTYTFEQVAQAKTGLTLKIRDLADDWTQRDFDILRRQVLGLSIVRGVRREGYDEDPGFEIALDAPMFEMGVGNPSDQVMNAGWGLLKGTVSEKGVGVLHLDAKGIGKVEFELDDLYEIAGVSYKIALIWQLKDAIRKPSILTLGLIQEIFEQWSGVKVYLDGFRIYPFGDIGDDWLEIDKDVAARSRTGSEIFRRVYTNLPGVNPLSSLLLHPSNRNLIGQVFISNSPKKIFEVTLNREGFVENDALKKLKRFIRQGLEWATIYYSYFRYKEQERRLKETVEEFGGILQINPPPGEIGGEKPEDVPILRTALNVLGSFTDKNLENLSEESKKEFESRAQSAVHVVEDSVSFMEKQLTLLRTVASSGALMLTFIHEARDVASKLDVHATSLEDIAKNLDVETGKRILKVAASMRNTRDRLDNQIKLFGSISRGLEANVQDRTRVSIRNVFDNVSNVFDGLKENYKFEIESDISDTLRTGPIMEAELYSILINLISNAVKAVIASDAGNKIRVEAFKTQDGTSLRVYDNGIGFAKEYRQMVFEPLAADPDGRLYKRLKDKIKYKDLLTLGEGTGMGLSIVKDIVESYGKHVAFIDVKKPWNTCIEVMLP